VYVEAPPVINSAVIVTAQVVVIYAPPLAISGIDGIVGVQFFYAYLNGRLPPPSLQNHFAAGTRLPGFYTFYVRRDVARLVMKIPLPGAQVRITAATNRVHQLHGLCHNASVLDLEHNVIVGVVGP
jgi:hypothetical protein